MDEPAKFDLILNAIVAARKKFSDVCIVLELAPPLKLPSDDLSAAEIAKMLPPPSLDSEGRFLGMSKSQVLDILEDFQKQAKVIKVSEANYPLNRRGREIIAYGVEDPKTGEQVWVSPEEFAKTGVVVSDDHPVADFQRRKITLSILPGFDNWYSGYLLKKEHGLAQLNLLNLAKVYSTVLDIEEKFQLDPSPQVEIDVTFRHVLPCLGRTFNPYEYRQDALKYLKRTGVVESFYPATINPLVFLDYSKTIEIRINIPKFQEFKAKIEEAYRAKEKETVASVDATPQPEAASEKPQSNCTLPASCRIEDLCLEFVSETSVRIRIPDQKPSTLTFSELGLQDRRRGDMPGILWETLQAFAEHNGVITWQSQGIPHRVQKRLGTHVQRLRKWFQSFFQTDQDPFHPYRPEKAYRCRFQIADKSYGGTGRPS